MSAETVSTCKVGWRERFSWVGPKARQPAAFPPSEVLLVAGFLAVPRLLTVLGCFCTAWPAAAGAACWLLRKILLVPLPAPALPLALSVLFLTMLCWGADATNDVSREAPGEMPTDAADQAPMYAKEGSNVQWKLVDPLEMVDIMVSLDLCALNI